MLLLPLLLRERYNYLNWPQDPETWKEVIKANVARNIRCTLPYFPTKTPRFWNLKLNYSLWQTNIRKGYPSNPLNKSPMFVSFRREYSPTRSGGQSHQLDNEMTSDRDTERNIFKSWQQQDVCTEVMAKSDGFKRIGKHLNESEAGRKEKSINKSKKEYVCLTEFH